MLPDTTDPVPEDGVPNWLQRRVPAKGAHLGGETSLRQVINRIVGAWAYWGFKSGHFDPTKGDVDDYRGAFGDHSVHYDAAFEHLREENALVFYREMRYMMLHQMAAPNSPSWFNAGLHWAYGIEGNACGLWRVDEQGLRTNGGDSDVQLDRFCRELHNS